MLDDRLYFRQLLSGRDFARTDQVAAQMVNFVYLIGDRQTRECLVVDPAYAVTDILQIIDNDEMNLTGVLATHYHPDHVGGSMMGCQIQGVAEVLEQKHVPIHVNRNETKWVSAPAFARGLRRLLESAYPSLSHQRGQGDSAWLILLSDSLRRHQ